MTSSQKNCPHAREPAVSLMAAPRAERMLSPQARPSQRRREQPTQALARTERVRLCDAARRLARSCANCRGGIAATARITGKLHQGVRCRSHLTRHKISDEDGSAASPRRKVTSYSKVTHRSGPRSLHRLVRWWTWIGGKTWRNRVWNERALRCMDDSEPELRKKARQTSDAIHETRDIRESRMSPPATPQSSGAKCV